MSYNGSGTFQINSSGQPVVTGTVISSTAFNALTADLATGLSTAITKDGQTTPTANIKLGGFKLTNVGTATTAGDALTFGSGTNSSTLAVPTRQVLTSGTTYTTPANVRQLKIRMFGGGGGGGGAGTSGGVSGGGNGGSTTFNSVNAGGGLADIYGLGGAGGSSVTGTASFRQSGQPGAPTTVVFGSSTQIIVLGGNGGGLGAGLGGNVGASAAPVAGKVNTGGGGGGGGIGYFPFGAYAALGGGGEGEYVELIINSPSAT